MKVSQAEPAPLKNGGHSLPYNLRSCKRVSRFTRIMTSITVCRSLSILPETVNRNHLYSWFVQLSCADAGGELDHLQHRWR